MNREQEMEALLEAMEERTYYRGFVNAPYGSTEGYWEDTYEDSPEAVKRAEAIVSALDDVEAATKRFWGLISDEVVDISWEASGFLDGRYNRAWRENLKTAQEPKQGPTLAVVSNGSLEAHLKALRPVLCGMVVPTREDGTVVL